MNHNIYSKSKKAIILDMILSLASAALPVATLQLFVLPWVSAKVVDSEAYGLILSYVSFFGLIPATLGGTLNNMRLIRSKDAALNNVTGDYNRILCLMAVFVAISAALSSLYLEHTLRFQDTALLVAISCLMLANDYFIVSFRIALNYKKVFLYNLVLASGYFLGYLFFLKSNLWQLIYIIGYTCATVFLLFQTRMWREPLKKSKVYRSVFGETTLLIISNFLNRVLNYADKFLLFPLIGGSAVSIIYCATFYTKILSLVITPINGVILSYLARIKKRPQKLFTMTLIIGSGLSVVGYFICLLISKPLLGLLYPAYVEEALHYIPITAASSMLATFNTLITPFVLQYCPIKWQLPINGIAAVAYVVSAYLLFNLYALTGFCIALVLGRIVRMTILLIVYYTKPKTQGLDSSQLT